jgi:hypothetical protein
VAVGYKGSIYAPDGMVDWLQMATPAAPACQAQRVGKRRAMFEKMQAGMEAMPEDFPPVAMFNNVAATRENSERILELLEKDRSGTEEPVVSPAK